MEKRRMPVQPNGMPVRVQELEEEGLLAPSRLDPTDKYNYGNHHYHYNAPWYRKDLIYNSMRNLQYEQAPILKDQHNIGRLALHMVFSEPERRPTPHEAMDRLEKGLMEGERFKVWNVKTRRYEYHEFTDEYWNALNQAYNLAT